MIQLFTSLGFFTNYIKHMFYKFTITTPYIDEALEIDYKYISQVLPAEDRYFHELQEKFHNTYRTIIYCISFILLGLHLNHGLASSFQSVGVSSTRQQTLKIIANIYSLLISIGFTTVAIFHHFSH